jgi:arginine/lysine/ornithine decarboxylase
LGDLKIVQAKLKTYQKRLLLSKIIEAGKRPNKDAKLVELIRKTDNNRVEFGVEGADVINQPFADLMFQVV